MIKFDVLNRWSGKVQFTAKIDCKKEGSETLKLGLAVKWAIKNDADLRNADLRNANLWNADLRNADLSDANLWNADLRNANLWNADLSDADLRNANLWNANLWNADLRNADLRNANLWNADLRNANLSDADLRNANLSDANLSDADLRNVRNLTYMICPEQGEFQAWKKLSDSKIALVKIPAKAGRITAIRSRKCRAEYVKVMKITDYDGNKVNGVFRSPTNCNKLDYKVGEIVRADEFNDDPGEECAGGIHFFMTKQEAINW